VKRKRKNDSNRQSDCKSQNQPSSQFAAVHDVRRFATHERICEAIGGVCAILVAWMSASDGHRIAIIWTSGIAIAALIFALCFWLTDREFSRQQQANEKQQTYSVEARIERVDELREQGRRLQRTFGAPTGILPEDEPNRWFEKVQIFLRSIDRSYADHYNEIVKDPRRHTGPAGLSPMLNQAEMMHWTNDDPRRQQAWPRITAVLYYLDQVRDELYQKISR
jgi:hypothetical protein